MHRRILGSLALLLLVPAFLTAQRVRPIEPVAYWAGKIRVEKTYQGIQGRYKWVGEYRVLLGEERLRYEKATLFPLELDYTIDADVALDKECYGVVSGQSQAWRVLGNASGRLRGESLDRGGSSNSSMDRKLLGFVDHRKQTGDQGLPFEPNEESYWDNCNITQSPKKYEVSIDFFESNAANRSNAEWLPFFQGIQASGDGLLRDLQENPLAFLGQGNEAVDLHICGLIDRPDQEVFRGSHSFSSKGKLDLCMPSGENGAANITISWELRRTRRRPTNETPSAGPTGGTPRPPGGGVPGADLALTVSVAPGPVRVGNNLTYSLTVTNKGPGIAIETVLTDILPNAVSFASASPSQGSCIGTSTVVCNLGTLGNRSSATVVIVATPTAARTLINRAKVISGVPDINPTNNSVTSTTRAR